VHPFHSWTNLVLALIAFSLTVSAASLGTNRDGLYLEPGRPDRDGAGAAKSRPYSPS
jgi:hypothetical protein